MAKSMVLSCLKTKGEKQINRKIASERVLNENVIAQLKRFKILSDKYRNRRKMLSYKCTASGRKYEEVESKYSTMACSNCKARNGPAGKAGLPVRSWECKECGSLHDRDRNAAINTLRIGLGMSLERVA